LSQRIEQTLSQNRLSGIRFGVNSLPQQSQGRACFNKLVSRSKLRSANESPLGEERMISATRERSVSKFKADKMDSLLAGDGDDTVDARGIDDEAAGRERLDSLWPERCVNESTRYKAFVDNYELCVLDVAVLVQNEFRNERAVIVERVNQAMDG
jgi:hypothetical protein